MKNGLILLLILFISFIVSCRNDGTIDPLTPEERNWLNLHDGEIRLGTEYLYNLYDQDNDGLYNGIASEYIKLIEKKLKFNFLIVRIEKWQEEYELVKARKIDVLNSLAGTTRMADLMLFTQPYFRFPAYLIMKDGSSMENIRDILKNKYIYHTPNEDIHQYLKKRFPQSTVTVIHDPIKGLQGVIKGEADAIVLSIVNATFYMKRSGVTDLKVIGKLDYQFQCSLASRNDWPILRNILQKGLLLITESEKAEIRRRWGLTQYFWNTTRFWVISGMTLASILILGMIILFWNSMLRKKVQEQTKNLSESKQRYQLLSNASFEGIFILEEEIIIDVNPQGSHILDYPVSEFTGKNILQFIAEDEREYFKNKMVAGEVHPFEFKMKRHDQTIIHVEGRVNSVTQERWPFVVLVVRDITERIIAEKKAKEHMEKLIQADKLISLGILVSGIAHEINNPNNTIGLNSALLEEVWKSIQPIVDEYYKTETDLVVGGVDYQVMKDKIPIILDSIRKNSNRIQEIVNNLKDYSRINTEDIKSSININQIVTEAIELLHNQIDQSTEHFNIQLESRIPPFKGNFRRIEQVIINLIENAILALPDKKHGLTVKTDYLESESNIVVEIADEGVGIPEPDLKYIEEPFFTTRRARGGVGLGLFITKKIITDHGGKIAFKSQVNQGTVVTVYLPVMNKKEE